MSSLIIFYGLILPLGFQTKNDTKAKKKNYAYYSSILFKLVQLISKETWMMEPIIKE